MRVAQTLLAKGQKADAIEILTVWASAANDQEGHKMLAEALRHQQDNPLARAAFARMEGLKNADTSPLDAARLKWSFEVLSQLEKDSKKPVGNWQAEVGYNNNVKYKGQVFHIQTEDSGVKRPHIITHLFADGGRILKSYKRSYAELITLGRDELVSQVRLWMKNQHKEMYIALREGRYDAIIEGREPGGMEVLDGAPHPEVRRSKADIEAEAKAARDSAEAPVRIENGALAPAAPPRVEARAEPAKVEAPVSPPRVEVPAAPVKIEPKVEARPSGAPRPAQAPAAVQAPRPATPAAGLKGPPRPAVNEAPAVVKPVRARLHVIRALGEGPMVHELRDDEMVIGRTGGVEVRGDKFVAPQHTRLRMIGRHLQIDPIDDLPVFVRLKQPTEIELGEVFVAGDQLLRVEPNPPPNDGPDRHPTYFYSSPKWSTTFRVVQIFEGGAPGLCVVARSSSLQIGRSHSDLTFPNDFWLNDSHCIIEDQGGDQDARFLMLTDLGSRGGTFIRLKQTTTLTTGDEILVGRTRLRVELVVAA